MYVRHVTAPTGDAPPPRGLLGGWGWGRETRGWGFPEVETALQMVQFVRISDENFW